MARGRVAITAIQVNRYESGKNRSWSPTGFTTASLALRIRPNVIYTISFGKRFSVIHWKATFYNHMTVKYL